MPYGDTIDIKTMKIGILTFHCAKNFGAVLQAFGLCQYLQRLGLNVSIVDYRPDYLIAPYRPFYPLRMNAGKKSWKLGILLIVRELLSLPIRYKRERFFNRFIRENLHLSPLQMDDKANDFDAFVFGSDQIWNCSLTQSDSVFWGNAPAFEGRKRIAYAASAGSIKVLDENAIVNLELFNAVSVRERSLADYLNIFLTKKIQVVLDPVLLAGRDVFRAIATTKHRSPYLLYFTLDGNTKLRVIAERLARNRNLELIEIISYNICFSKSNVKHVLSVNEFLGLFMNADFVVTKSFHGTAFSVLFEREFMVYYDEKEVPERMYNLLNALNLDNRLKHIDDLSLTSFPIAWHHVNEKLEKMRVSSRQFLAEALGC